MCAQGGSAKPLRLPEWFRVKLPQGPEFAQTRALVDRCGLNTVCRSARCPNMWECFSRSTATFMILGNLCSRSCAFCNVPSVGGRGGGGRLLPPDPGEPGRVAAAAAELDLRHVVVTSVTRDDLPDGGAAHFAAVVAALRAASPQASIELLVPDFQGDEAALMTVLASGPDVLNHNVETVPRLYGRFRPQADYRRSLQLLERVHAAGIPAKSGLMLGMGETGEELRGVLADLARAGCSMATLGQYLPPSLKHPPVARYVHPDEFAAYAEDGRRLGIAKVMSGPLVRSSYRAGDMAG